ncbi:hypothetical protein AU106_gp024 [Sinorhizobium phage phiM9]|uniref:Uncharacterized protein n=1 Tax=Sinorhizobium phage phiM9 TaxID=1636182 RepID=A0A0F6R5Q7_9CAUD|nr:hypothetical protein AU106_gp024 [Sinorhizobium phage phiM9]AKE44655.1 hypothetical protein Sm_phiM9_025 [Sinorhizobium phage phiM9]
MMELDKYKKIAQDVVDEWFFDKLEFREDYSGRAMYGETTFGVVGDLNDIFTFMQVFGAQCNEEDLDPIMSFRVDSMGLQSIVYYHH